MLKGPRHPAIQFNEIVVPGPTLGELGGQCNGRACERLADRAVFLGLLGRRSETRLIQTGHFALDRKANASNAFIRLESNLGLGLQLDRRRARASQSVGQRHAKATGMGGGDQLFGAGLAVRLLCAGRPGNRVLSDAGRIEGDYAAAFEQFALPDGMRYASCGHVGFSMTMNDELGA